MEQVHLDLSRVQHSWHTSILSHGKCPFLLWSAVASEMTN